MIPEEFETSIEIFSQVLEAYHIPKNIIDAEVKAVRAERYGILRATGPVRPSFEKIVDLLTAGTAETFYVGPDCPAAGRTLAQLDLRARTGATVIAVVRGEESHTGPAADFLVEPGDTKPATPSARCPPRIIRAASRKSDRRALVHDPMNTRSTLTSSSNVPGVSPM